MAANGIRKFIHAASMVYRAKRFQKILNELDVKNGEKIIDFCGVKVTWLGTRLEENITLVNILFFRKILAFNFIPANASDLDFFSDKKQVNLLKLFTLSCFRALFLGFKVNRERVFSLRKSFVCYEWGC